VISVFFINRPAAANVIAFLTIILGVVGLWCLPVERYPNITPPTIQVTASYPGASAQVMSDTVAAPLEQQINGVENMLYMTSTSSSNGSYSLTVTFEVGTDLEAAQVLVQNRVALAEPFLPTDVRQQAISVKKQSTNILLVISLTSPDETFDGLYLANYANLRLKDELSRVDGVGDVTVSGTGSYSMRIWVDPPKMDARGLTFTDLLNQLRQQNVQVAAGQIAQPPVQDAQAFQYTMTALGRLSDPKQFEALQTMARLAKEQFPETIGFDWSGVSLQESQAKGEEIYIFGLEVFWVSYRSSLPPEPLRPADGLSEQQSAVA
jgi:multidrug efflux pump subunit AcrB